jgi:putative nucleotidyltransferase with HDIG domain
MNAALTTEDPTTVGASGKPKAPAPWAHLKIPPFPRIAIEVLQLASGENASMREISDLITSEPAFSSEVVTIANCPLYARRVPVTNVLQAIALLGTQNLKGLCLTVGVRAYLGDALDNTTLRAIWRHSLACALIAEELARVGSIDENSAYTAGLMHDVGRLALAVLRPREYAALLDLHAGTPRSILRAERELFGFDHCEAGRSLVADWKLPTSFTVIVSEHHLPGGPESVWGIPTLINLSCRIADALGFAVFAGCETSAYVDLLDELPARERKVFSVEVADLALDIAGKINAIEQG